MPRTPQEATERTIRVAKLQIVQQEARIERQELLVPRWKRMDTPIRPAKPMNSLLARMQNDLSLAEKRLQGLSSSIAGTDSLLRRR